MIRSHRMLDIVAVIVLLCYGLLAWGAEAGGRFALTPLDPTWTRIQWRGTVRVATDVGFRPFADEQNGQLVGYDIDLAQAVAEGLGLQVTFVPTGFDALYDALTSGKADIIVSALPYAPERSDRARFSTVYFDAGQVLVTRADTPIAGTADLSGRRLGVALGSDADAYARRLVDTHPQIKLDSHYETPNQAVADLCAGQLDALITDNVSALIAVQSTPGLQIVVALTSEPYVLALPPEAFQFQAEVNRVLEDLRATDFFTELNQRWFHLEETHECL